MHRSHPLLVKAGKSITTEASKVAVAGDVVKAVASAGSHHHDGKIPQALPYPYELLYHHKHTSLLQYRSPGSFAYFMHHMTSAASAVISLCTSQEDRDRFLALTGTPPSDSKGNNDSNREAYSGSFINTSILGQSDIGFLKVLALYQDLNSPLYHGMYKKNPKFLHEFMDGCGWALEQFHRTSDRILPKFINSCEEEARDLEDADKNGASDSKKEVDFQLESDYNFLDAARDQDSLENTFMSMTTPEMLEAIKMEGITRLIVGGMVGREKAAMPPLAIVRNSQEVDELREYYAKSGKVRLVKDDTKVMNVALLSARVEEIHPPPDLHSERTKQERGVDPDSPLEDDSLAPYRNADDEDKAQTVTQLEVLYELEQSSINDDDKTHTQTSVMVGKFEACLEGDPNGDILQWRLCSYRPATEFGYFNSW